MSLIIDGYNLLNASDILAPGSGPGGLSRARLALLNFVVASVTTEQLQRTTVVFDAGPAAPRGLPRVVDFHGLTVRFASRYPDADALIEELIQEHTAPRSLTVVSSDHRIQRAAKRRRAKAVDSERWHAEMKRRNAHRPSGSPKAAKPPPPSTDEEIDYWMEQFADDSTSHEPTSDGPFPPGYAEDLENLLDQDEDLPNQE